mmetsp:Transcript_17234/g.53404  ORF Transcript_17234/g.53404 Transcript_17234/m.53404 type:complete len:246 (-) Transcript_17234:939-1676(-)
MAVEAQARQARRSRWPGDSRPPPRPAPWPSRPAPLQCSADCRWSRVSSPCGWQAASGRRPPPAPSSPKPAARAVPKTVSGTPEDQRGAPLAALVDGPLVQAPRGAARLGRWVPAVTLGHCERRRSGHDVRRLPPLPYAPAHDSPGLRAGGQWACPPPPPPPPGGGGGGGGTPIGPRRATPGCRARARTVAVVGVERHVPISCARSVRVSLQGPSGRAGQPPLALARGGHLRGPPGAPLSDLPESR